MKNIILIFLLIFLFPILIYSQEIKPVINGNTLIKESFSTNFSKETKEIQSNDSIRYNMIKIAAFLLISDVGFAIFSLGYEFKINKHISCELITTINGQGSDAAFSSVSLRAGVKYYFTEKHNPYVSAFIRYQQFDYANDDIDNKINNAEGYGIGCMLGSFLKLSRVLKVDVGMGLFYSYRVPAYNKQFDVSVLTQGLYMIPRVHLCFCF